MEEIEYKTITDKYNACVEKVCYEMDSNKLNIDDMKKISCASNLFGIQKRNRQSEMFDTQSDNGGTARSTVVTTLNKDRILDYMRRNKCDIQQLNYVKSAFLQCEMEENSINDIYIKKNDFFDALREDNFTFSRDFIFSVIEDLQVDPDDKSPSTLLSYSKLKQLIAIYSSCPVIDSKDRNQSHGFKKAIDIKTTYKEVMEQGRAERLIKFVHQRIEEKFKGFRSAYRTFDKDYNGGLDFNEFMQGLENIGIILSFQDYKLIFDSVDYDNEGEIDYNKFLLLNTDNKKHEKIEYMEQKKKEREENKSFQSFTFSSKS